MKNNKSIYLLFLVVGLVISVGSIFFIKNTLEFVQTAAHTNGKVIEIVARTGKKHNNTYAPKVSFQLENGQESTFVSHVYSSNISYHVGQSVAVLYSPTSPTNAELNNDFTLWIGPAATSFLGLIFTLIGGLAYLSTAKRSKEIARLKTIGQKVQAIVMGIQVKNYRVNHITARSLLCNYGEGSSIATFESDDLFFDPSDSVNGKTVSVYFDPTDHKKYYVDTEELFEKKLETNPQTFT